MKLLKEDELKEKKQNYWKHNVGDVLKNEYYDFTITNRYYNTSNRRYSYTIKCNKCGFDSDKEHYYLGKINNPHAYGLPVLRRLKGCPCCDSKKYVVPGINDINSTDVWLSNLLLDYEEGFKYSRNSVAKIWFKCPYCQKKHLNKIT